MNSPKVEHESSYKVQVENCHSYNKAAIDFNFGIHKDYLLLKVVFSSPFKPQSISLLRVDKLSCLPPMKLTLYIIHPQVDTVTVQKQLKSKICKMDLS